MNTDFVITLFNHIDAGIIITQPDFKITFINQFAKDLATEITGKPLTEAQDIRLLFEDLIGQDTRIMLDKIIHGKNLEKIFIDLSTDSGRNLNLELNFIPVSNRGNQPDHFEFIINDLTQQKLFENKLVNQAKNISNFIDNAHAIIIGVDTRGYITEWNNFASVTTGYQKNEVYTQKLVDKLIPESHQGNFSKVLSRAIHQKGVRNYEIPIYTSDQSIKILLLSLTPRISVTGEAVGVTLMGSDITELSQYRQSLEQKVDERTRELKQSISKEKEVVEMKNRFVSIASHEFRTPLHSIQYYATELNKNKVIQKSRRLVTRINEIEKLAHRMTLLLDDVLTYSKSEPGKIKLMLHAINLLEFLDKTCEEVYLSTRKTHTIKKEFLNLPEYLKTDEKLLRNILINLLTNAIKYSPGKNQISLTVKGSEEHLEIDIRDEGIGIPREDLASIFEPFNRSQSAASIPGTGLGLSIVKRAVDLLNGSIRIDSQVNLGTEVSIKIPLRLQNEI